MTVAAIGDHIGKLLQELARDFQQRSLTKCRQRGHHRIRFSHTKVLHHLGLEGISLTALAQRGGITQQATGKLVRELERIGYVSCLIDARDKRSKVVRLTERGSELMRDIAEVLEEVRGEYCNMLGEPQLQSFEHQLRTTADALRLQVAAETCT
jgi:DNA-binding MarR family transcriptional regulator